MSSKFEELAVTEGPKFMSRRGFLTCLAAGSAVMLCPTVALAEEFEDGDSAIADEEAPVSSAESFIVGEDETKTLISVFEDDATRTVTAVALQTGETNRIIYDLSGGTVFSTYTNETVVIDTVQTDSGIIEPRSSKVSYRYKKISYAQIKSITGNALNVASLAAAIAALGGASLAVSVAGLVVAVASCIVGVSNPSTSHGLRLKIKTTKRYRRGSSAPFRIEQSIVEVTQY